MTEEKKPKKRMMRELTAEELLVRSITYKRKFRVIVRLVIANIFWLQEVEDIETEGIGTNLTRNLVLIFKKGLGKTFLSIEQKGILRKPPAERTEQEMIMLYRIIGGLKCFRKYTEEMKKRLCLVTYFKYYGNNRIINRQGHMGYAMYFIVTGKLKVSQLEYDPALEIYENNDIAEMEAGDMFGEISLLNEIERTVTVTTVGDVELLQLTKEDFTVVLKTTVQREWDLIVNSMKRFSYFNEWSTDAFRDCCVYTTYAKYEKGKVLVGGEDGNSNYAFFLLKGICQLIVSMAITITERHGIKHYKLFEDEVITISEIDITDPEVVKRNSTLVSNRSSKSLQSNTSKKSSKIFNDETELRCVEPVKKSLARRKTIKVGSVQKDVIVPIGEEIPITLPPDTDVYFMRVCQFKELSVFSLGEEYENGKIIAETPVEVLKIPRYFLFKKNIGNVWNKLKRFLEINVPTKKVLFNEFIRERKWKEHCLEMKNNLIKNRKACFSNKLENVPYSLRINE